MMMRICNRFVHVDADDDFLGHDDDFFGHHDVFFCAATCHDRFCSNFQNFPDDPAKSSKFPENFEKRSDFLLRVRGRPDLPYMGPARIPGHIVPHKLSVRSPAALERPQSWSTEKHLIFNIFT